MVAPWPGFEMSVNREDKFKQALDTEKLATGSGKTPTVFDVVARQPYELVTVKLTLKTPGEEKL
jgi:hypothetical protein